MASSDSIQQEFREGDLWIELAEAAYSRKALLLTCYWYTDRAYVYIAVPEPGRFAIRFRPKDDAATLREISDHFLNSLLENELRTLVEAETASVRETLIAAAFADRLPSQTTTGELVEGNKYPREPEE